jgi:hypothetical protein
MRPDRDNYVKINWENIREGMAYNFDSFGSDRINSRGSTYDFPVDLNNTPAFD